MMSAEIVRTQVALTGGGVSSSAIWLIDSGTAYFLLGQKATADYAVPGKPRSPNGEAEAPEPDDAVSASVERLLDIPLSVDCELARIKMMVRDITQLGNGSIIEIEKSVGDLVDLLVAGRLVARGEVVVVDGYFGVRVVDILAPKDRLKRELTAA
jgi:flagellar motor switch protein FliN/FliY